MVKCDYCGEEFGNEGALASHQAHCDQKPQEQPPQTQQTQQTQPARQATQPREGQPPAPQTEQAQSGQSAPLPATQDSLTLGAQLGQSLALMGAGDEEQKAEAKGSLAQTVGATVASAGKAIAERQLEATREAKRRANDELQVSNDYPRCPECQAQIKQIPPGEEEFPCPGCGVMLK